MMDSQDSTTENSSLFNHTSSGYYDDDDDIINDDKRPELNFDKKDENPYEKAKRKKIEEALENPKSNLDTWRQLAIDDYGLVGDDLRLKIWPLLMEIDPNPIENTPKLEDLKDHHEYQQVVMDVNRSLKRFPPGIPYKQRLALQDQLTVLILRVIIKYPDLRYYQGYHDVAITFLLVLGEALAFRVMERLSTDHLKECMEPTMEKTNFRLNYMYAILYKVDRQLFDFMDRSEVGTMFALPWYLTWFGHNLNEYKDVVRMYDYFLATPPLMPLYVCAALVVERREEVFQQSCDMASVHCLLSRIPDDLNCEKLIKKSKKYHMEYPPNKLENFVKKRLQNEAKKRLQEQRIRNRYNQKTTIWGKMRNWILYNYKTKLGIIFATAVIIIGYYAYYYKQNFTFPPRILWGQTS